MDTDRRSVDDLLDIARALLMVQGAILVAATIEALIVGAALHAPGGPVLMSGAAAAVILIARSRLRPVRRWPRRLVYLVEGLTLATITVDTALAIVLAHPRWPWSRSWCSLSPSSPCCAAQLEGRRRPAPHNTSPRWRWRHDRQSALPSQC